MPNIYIDRNTFKSRQGITPLMYASGEAFVHLAQYLIYQP